MKFGRESSLSPEELAGIIGLSTATLAAWRSRGEGPSWLKPGRRWLPRLTVRLFSEAPQEFLGWANLEHRDHTNTSDRLATSFASLARFFSQTPVGLIDAIGTP